jgi:glycosyltransferase involved in cell wall biosynthesis
MTDPGRKTILFVAPSNSSFVRQDAEMLTEHFDVQRFEFGSRKGFQMLVYQLKLCVWLLRRLPAAAAVYIWFGDYHSFLPTLLARLFRRPSLLVIGGYDAARLPAYNYGGHNSKLRSYMIRKSCDWATKLLPVSDFVNSELSQRIGDGTLPKREVIHNGVDIAVFQTANAHDSARSGAICVSIADTVSRAQIKGLDRYADVARQFPDEAFVLVGVTGAALAYLHDLQVPNLQLMGLKPRAELQALYSRARLVCQFSRFESFGMALAEGMLCGCIPVTLPGVGTGEILSQDSGYVARTTETQDLVIATQQAFAQGPAMAIQARQRILSNFSLEKRGLSILAVFKALGIGEGDTKQG